jgi:hypothetical protein
MKTPAVGILLRNRTSAASMCTHCGGRELLPRYCLPPIPLGQMGQPLYQALGGRQWLFEVRNS